MLPLVPGEVHEVHQPQRLYHVCNQGDQLLRIGKGDYYTYSERIWIEIFFSVFFLLNSKELK